MMNILIIKTSSLGDIVHTFPVLHYLRKKFPTATLDWVVEKPFKGLVEAHPFINQTLTIDTKKWRKGWLSKKLPQEIAAFRNQLQAKQYDTVFDLQSNIKSGFVTFLAKSNTKIGFGWRTVHELPNLLFTNHHINPPSGLNIRDDYLKLVQIYFEDHMPFDGSAIQLNISAEQKAALKRILNHSHLQQGPKLLVCPGSAWRNKQLSKEALSEFLQHVQRHLNACFLFVWGTPEEKQHVEELQEVFPSQSVIVDRLALPLLQNLMDQVNLVIAMDSLPLHLAGTTTTPTYSVFGASSAFKFKPMGSQHIAYQGTCPYGKKFEKRCPILRTCKTGSCIRSISGQQLFNHFLLTTDFVYPKLR